MSGPSGGNALTISGVSKNFGGLKALTGVDMAVQAGHVTSIIGPNGAGKSTLLGVIAGELAPDSGSVSFGDRVLTGLRPEAICRAGVARTFQSPKLFPNMTCIENVMVGRHTRTSATLVESIVSAPRARRQARESRDRAMTLLELVGVARYAQNMPTAMSFGNQRRVELARALATEPSVLLMDEPSGGLASHVIDEFLDLVRRIVDDGLTVLLIEHNMSVVAAMSTHVVALDHGVKIAEGDAKSVLSSENVREAYLGRDGYRVT